MRVPIGDSYQICLAAGKIAVQMKGSKQKACNSSCQCKVSEGVRA